MAQGKSAKDQLGVDVVEATPVERIEVTPPAVEDTREEWLPENFKTPEEFVASYKESQNRIREDAESRKRMEAQIEGLTKVVEELRPSDEPSTQGADADYKAQLQAAFETDPIGTMAYLAAQAAGQTVEEKLKEIQSQNDPAMRQSAETQNQMLAMMVDRQLGETYDDWGEYRDRVGEEINKDQSLLPPAAFQSPENTVRAIARVYQVLKAQDVLENAEKGNTGFVTDQMKRTAQTMTGQGGRPAGLDPTDEKMAQLKAATKDMSYSAWRG